MFTLSRARPEDVPLLKDIAIASKGHWGYPENLMLQFAAMPIITSQIIQEDIVYKASHELSIIGWYRLSINISPIVLEDLWVLPAFIGKGIGRALFEHAVGQVRAQGAAHFELDADPNARPFYEKVGCVVVGETLTEWDRMVPRMRYSFIADNHL